MRVLVPLFLTCTLLFGCEADGVIWMPVSDTADPLFRFIKNGHAGFIDRLGHIVIPPTLEVGSNWDQAFEDGMLSLDDDDGSFLDATGRRVLNNGFFSYLGFFRRSRACTRNC